MDCIVTKDASRIVPARRVPFSDGVKSGDREERREVPVEAAIALSYGSLPYAVMMATPADLEDFVYGFSLTEGVIDAPAEIRSIAIRAAPDGISVQVELMGERMARHLARTRVMAGRTGCGLCGVADLASLPRAKLDAQAPAPAVSASAIAAALARLEAAQPLNERTRAVHAAAFADESGCVALVREDVGRHNALDKVVGALARSGRSPVAGFVLITSRCSFEMVEKAAAAGLRTLVAVSAPTSLAIERAQIHGMTLIAIARSDYGLEFVTGADGAPT